MKMLIQPHILAYIQSHKEIDDFDCQLAIDWAIKLLENGIETDHVLILTTFSNKDEKSEISFYLSKVLADLGLEEKKGIPAHLAKIHYHLEGILQQQNDFKNLQSIYEIYLQYRGQFDLEPFYFLYHAWTELEELGENFYTKDVDIESVQESIQKEAHLWIKTNI